MPVPSISILKTLGAILIISGLVISIIGYGQYSSVMCHCPAQIQGKPFNCGCIENPIQITGHLVTYAGLAISGSGILLFVLGWKKQRSIVGV